MFKKFCLFVLALCIPLLATFAYIDYKVAKHLRLRKTQKTPAILSDSIYVTQGTKLRPALIESELRRRHYNEVQQVPQAPAEFRIKGNLIDFVTKVFVYPTGNVRPSSYVKYNTEDGSIENALAATPTSFELEPAMVAPLGVGDLKLSRYKKLEQIPYIVQQAIIAIEDQRFYWHPGIDITGIARALYRNYQAGKIVEGGSTITQQLAKNLLFSPKRTIGRKILEAFAAFSLEIRLTKPEILELYLNEVYFGQEGSVAIHGIQSATNAFFGKNIAQISLSEAATLAAIIQAPSYYSPKRHLERARKRRDDVLAKMFKKSFISAVDLRAAMQDPLEVVSERQYQRVAPYFTSVLKQELAEDINISAAILSGTSIHTGLSHGMQACAEASIENGLKSLASTYPLLKKHNKQLQGALVAIEPHSGLIKAWVGGKDFAKNQFDRVSQGQRQIGSTIKPFLYLTALDANLNDYRVATARSVLSDRPLKIDLITKQKWEPENYDKEFRGNVTLRYALEKSLNIPAVYVAQRVGIDALVNTIKLFRVSDEPPAVPALALGAADTSLLKLTAAYAALANGGIYIKPRLYISALDNEAKHLAQSYIVEEAVADKNAVYVLTNILQGVLNRGTGRAIRALGYSRPAAGKTGTSSDSRDAWFVGYTPNLVAGVWVAFDDARPIKLTGGAAATPIWGDFMKCAEPYHEDIDFMVPSDVVKVKLDATTGKLATNQCPKEEIVEEIFVRGTEPTKYCPRHGGMTYEEEPQPELIKEVPKKREKRRRKGLWEILFGD